MKILAITFGDGHVPSTRYRLLNYETLLANTGDVLSWIPRRNMAAGDYWKCKKADVVINQKCLMPIFIGWLIRRFSHRLLFEFDDALWLRQGKPYNFLTQRRVNSRLRWWCQNSDVITCTNDFLASYARRFNKNVHVVPTGIVLPEVSPKLISNDQFVIGWSGSASSLCYLEGCESNIARFFQKHPAAKLRILCDKKPNIKIPHEFVKWSPEAEASFFSNLSAGLLPLDENDPFALGKSPVKAVSTLSYGIPVVGNMTRGGASEIAKNGGCVVVHAPDEWTPALESLLDAGRYRQLSLAALENVRENHDIKKVFECWRKLVRG
jgi:hypothetical protein